MGRVLDLAEEETRPRIRRLIGYFAQALACLAYGLHPKYFSFQLSDMLGLGICYEYHISGAVCRTISVVIKGKRKVHVIELVKHIDIYEQWKYNFKAVDNWGALMHLRLSFLEQENVEFSKQGLKDYFDHIAEVHGIELECNVIAINSLADIDVSLLEMWDGKFVVVNGMFVLSKMLLGALALEKLLQRVRDVMRADIMIVVEHDANHNQSDFLLRFDESLEYCSSLFKELDEDIYGIEAYYRYQICNIVACEGSNMVELHQTLAQWKSFPIHYGFSIFNFSTKYVMIS
ncbi:hypothetical protein SLA2020_296100 [Shorea laevis]